MASVKTSDEAQELLNLVEECPDFEGMTYRDGVISTLLWVLGHTDEPPYSEDDKE